MHIYRGLPSPFSLFDCALAIGNFDGVHLGHQALLSQVVAAARDRGLVPAVLTFEPHPKEVFGHEQLLRISTLRDKYQAILACGIQRIYVLPFTSELASLTPAKFAKRILAEGLACRWVTVGENFSFGVHRSGTFETLQELGRHYGFEAVCTPLLFHGQARISSSRIRASMALGDLHEVELMLGRHYTITGRVIHGAALGRQLGFPTLNQFVLPPGSNSAPALHGVFAVRVTGLDQRATAFPGVASLGFKPTVSTVKRWLLETHVFNWNGDAYGRLLRVEFVDKIRDEKKFSGIEELKAAIAQDVVTAKQMLGVSAS